LGNRDSKMKKEKTGKHGKKRAKLGKPFKEDCTPCVTNKKATNFNKRLTYGRRRRKGSTAGEYPRDDKEEETPEYTTPPGRKKGQGGARNGNSEKNWKCKRSKKRKLRVMSLKGQED